MNVSAENEPHPANLQMRVRVVRLARNGQISCFASSTMIICTNPPAYLLSTSSIPILRYGTESSSSQLSPVPIDTSDHGGAGASHAGLAQLVTTMQLGPRRAVRGLISPPPHASRSSPRLVPSARSTPLPHLGFSVHLLHH